MPKSTVWRSQQRYLDEGVPGLKRDKSWPSRVTPPNATHWASALMAESVGIAASRVGR